MEMSATVAELAKALCNAQGKMKHAIKGANNPFFGSKYADLASVVDASRPALVENGLSVVQFTEGKTLYTMLLHSSGEWICGSIPLKPMHQVKGKGWEESDDPQSYGSCLTYARRYGMAAITGVATDDDDGNAATGRTAGQVAEEKPPVSLDDAVLKSLREAKNPDEWKIVWNAIPVGSRHGYAAEKEAARVRFAGAGKAA